MTFFCWPFSWVCSVILTSNIVNIHGLGLSSAISEQNFSSFRTKVLLRRVTLRSLSNSLAGLPLFSGDQFYMVSVAWGHIPDQKENHVGDGKSVEIHVQVSWRLPSLRSVSTHPLRTASTSFSRLLWKPRPLPQASFSAIYHPKDSCKLCVWCVGRIPSQIKLSLSCGGARFLTSSRSHYTKCILNCVWQMHTPILLLSRRGKATLPKIPTLSVALREGRSSWNSCKLFRWLLSVR